MHNELPPISYENIVNAIPDGALIFKCNEDAQIVCSNAAMWKLFECGSEAELMEFSKGCFYNLVLDADVQGLKEFISKSVTLEVVKTHRMAYRVVTKKGKQIEVEDCGGVIAAAPDGALVLIQVNEITQNTGLLMEINDRLTGVYSVQQFFNVADEILRRADARGDFGQYSFIYYNVRNFKFYNTKYGRLEGDKLLCEIADLIRTTGTEIMVTRMGSDHFVSLSKDPHVFDVVSRGNVAFNKLYKSMGLSLKSGIYKVHDTDVDISYACDMAKCACDKLHDTAESVLVYTNTLEQRVNLEKYIVEHFEEALANQYIKPYYQPVVRSLTGEVCGCEALARWNDPELGNISPKDFILVLEKKLLISKLDMHMLRCICRHLRAAEKAGLVAVPISFNVSRIDFTAFDVCETIESIIEEYGIPRDLINIEITESAVMENYELIKRESERLREAGYQVWMDDFGSGYSSLNVLKEYQFDVIKLDMLFLRSFDERSQDMLRSLVQMCKKLGIHTLAEGVETQEQFDFLKSIGCEKLQGYLFSKPLSADEIFRKVQCGDLVLEKKLWCGYYDRAGRLDFNTGTSFCIVENDGKEYKILHINDEFHKIAKSLGLDEMDKLNYLVNNPSSSLRRKLRNFAKEVHLGQGFANMDFSLKGQYLRLRSKCICENLNRRISFVEIFLLQKEKNAEKVNLLDNIFRMMGTRYDFIFLVHSDGVYENVQRDVEGADGSSAFVDRETIRQYMHPADIADFMKFTHPASLKERLLQSERGYDGRYLRFRYDDKGYKWSAHVIQYIPEMDMIIYSIKSVQLNQEGLVDKMMPGSVARKIGGLEGDLWQSLMDSDTFSIFWKDKDRVLKGVNKHFLETLGIADAGSIIGKKDEEINWLLSRTPIEEEIKVIDEGVSVYNQVQKIVIDGSVRTILINKEPIFHDGKIVGLFGYFSNLDEMGEKCVKQLLNVENAETDTQQKLLSAQGVGNVITHYLNSWDVKKDDFIVIRIDFAESKRNYRDFGFIASQKIVKKVIEILSETAKDGAMVGRMFVGRYVLIKKSTDKDADQAFLDRVLGEFKAVHEIDGYPVTFYPVPKMLHASDTRNPGELLALVNEGVDAGFGIKE